MVYSINDYTMLKTARLFANGRSQAVRLPKEFRFEGEEVFIKRVGNMVVLIPYNEPWQTLLDSLDQFSEDFMDERNQPTDQQERDEVFE